MTTVSNDNVRPLEERAKQTDKEGKCLTEKLNSIRFINVIGYSHETGSSYRIDYDYNKPCLVDYEELVREMLVVPNGIKAEIKIVEEKKALKDYATKEKEVVPRLVLLVEADKQVADISEREEILRRGIRKVIAGIENYLRAHPNAEKPKDNPAGNYDKFQNN